MATKTPFPAALCAEVFVMLAHFQRQSPQYRLLHFVPNPTMTEGQ